MSADAVALTPGLRAIGLRRGSVFAFAATVLVFFNYLYFLKWFPVLESRMWVVVLLLVGLPGAIASTRNLQSAALPALFLIVFEIVVCANFLVLQRDYFDPRYLAGHLIMTLPFFVIGVLAASQPAYVRNVLLAGGLAFVAILGWCFVTDTPLHDDVGFADILHIRSSFGDESYRSHYQLIGYGIAFGALMVISSLVVANRVVASYAVLACVFAISLWVGARGPLTALLVSYAVILAARYGIAKTVRQIVPLALAAAVLLFVIDISNTAFVQKLTLDLNAGSNAGFTSPEIERQSRVNLYTAALHGWLASPMTLLFGNGFGSFSVGYGSQYPSWVFSPIDDYIYPHNFVLEVLYDLGIVGLIPLLLALLSQLRRLTSPSLTALELCMLSLLVFTIASALVSGTVATNHILYFALGLAGSVSSREPAPE